MPYIETEEDWFGRQEFIFHLPSYIRHKFPSFSILRLRWMIVDWGDRLAPLLTAEAHDMYQIIRSWLMGEGPHLFDTNMYREQFYPLIRYDGIDHRIVHFGYAMEEMDLLGMLQNSVEGVALQTPFPEDEFDRQNQQLSRSPYELAKLRQRDWLRHENGSHIAETYREKVEELFCHQFRDVVGNPFRPVTIDPNWRTSNVLDQADTIDEHGRFELLPFLADALQEAGCQHSDVLKHCLGPGVHVRGCWLIDQLLDRRIDLPGPTKRTSLSEPLP